MFTLIFLCVAAAALHSGAPWLFSFALTGLLVTIFPVVIVLVVVAAVAVWAFRYFTNKR